MLWFEMDALVCFKRIAFKSHENTHIAYGIIAFDISYSTHHYLVFHFSCLEVFFHKKNEHKKKQKQNNIKKTQIHAHTQERYNEDWILIHLFPIPLDLKQIVIFIEKNKRKIQREMCQILAKTNSYWFEKEMEIHRERQSERKTLVEITKFLNCRNNKWHTELSKTSRNYSISLTLRTFASFFILST